MSWPGYKPTPLRFLPKLAARAGIGAILYKDEAERFGIGSFKALGGAYAVFKLLRKTIWEQKNIVASTPPLSCGTSKAGNPRPLPIAMMEMWT